jgi:hypothetical protein
MQKLLVIAAALCIAIGTMASTASAGIYDPANSFLGFKLGSVPLVRFDASADGSLVRLIDSDGGGDGLPHRIEEDSSVFQTTNYFVQSAAFTGLPNLTGLKITLHAGSGQFDDGFTTPNPVGPGLLTGIGGQEDNTGQAILVAGGFVVTIPLDVVGSGGTTLISPVLGNPVLVTGAPFAADGPQVITGITTNIVYSPAKMDTGVAFTLNLTTVQLISAYELTALGVIEETSVVTVTGTNTLQSASKGGMVTLVSPFRVDTGNLAGSIPGAIYKKFVFVPEPGTMLLLVSGAVGLAVIGRKRMRK